MKHAYLLLAFAILTRTALACSVVAGTPVQGPAERAWRSDIVLVGTVTAFSQEDWPQDLTVEVESYLKGSGSNTITVTGLNAGHSCSDFLSLGDRKLFFLKAPAGGSANYTAIYDSAFGSTRTADTDTINLITTALSDTGIWAGTKDVGEGWKETAWFGEFYQDSTTTDWVWHPFHGWIIATGTPQALWLWDTELGWIWTSPDTYPYVYSDMQSRWLYFNILQPAPPVEETGGLRWVYDSQADSWSQVPMSGQS